MEQPETPQGAADPGAAPAPSPPAAPEPAAKVELPDPKGALPIPDHFRLPFRGKMATPTAVPSATERLNQMERLRRRRRRRGFLLGLLAGQILIIALDVGGRIILHTHPHVKIQAPIGIPSIVFLGMAAGAAVMLLAIALIYAVLGVRALFRKRLVAAAGGGLKRLILTILALGVSIGVIIGTAWFMIPEPEWKPTAGFAREQGLKALEASKAKVRSVLGLPPRVP